MEGAEVTRFSRLFQTQAAATGKAQSSNGYLYQACIKNCLTPAINQSKKFEMTTR